MTKFQQIDDDTRRKMGLGPSTKQVDPAYQLLTDDYTSTPTVHRTGCYICEDPEFAQMGLPLCRSCPRCERENRGSGHIAADDSRCDVCGFDEMDEEENRFS